MVFKKCGVVQISKHYVVEPWACAVRPLLSLTPLPRAVGVLSTNCFELPPPAVGRLLCIKVQPASNPHNLP